MPIFLKIRNFIQKVPKGKVTTYEEIAKVLGVKDFRMVGWALHGNKNPKIPCHRVVNQFGCLASGYTLGGQKAQKEKLEKEGVKFVNKFQVDLARHLWKPNV